MPKLPILSGLDVIKLLSRNGFQKIDQHGSHAILIKNVEARKLKVIVPLHKEIRIGTLLSILRQANLTREEFFKLLE